MKVSFSGIFGGLICIGIGFFFLYGTWETYSEYKRVQDYSGRTIGHITNKHFKLASDGGGNYFIEYWFMASPGTRINSSSVIAKQQWDMLRVDDTLEIGYAKSNPDRNLPMYGGSPSLMMAFFLFVMGAVFILFGGSRFHNSFHKRKSSNRYFK